MNPLNSCDALKMRKELSSTSEEGLEPPIVKSLFCFKGNSKFKKDEHIEKVKEDAKSNIFEDSMKKETKAKPEEPKIVFSSG